ncbi:MAG: glycosyltransferase family 4 protein [Pyrinomonadaceae bacterium]
MKVLLLNQCFYPDVAATGQYLTELGKGLVDRGHSVTVLTSRRAYDDPNVNFPKRQTWKGIKIIRLSTFGLGKKGRARRALDFASFSLTCVLRLALLPRFDVVIALTSPPLISWLGSMFVRIKGGRLVFWVMDLNPDEAIAAGWLKQDSFTARTLEYFLGSSMRHSAKIIALDRFVKQRILGKGIPEAKISVIPPWSHDEDVRYDSEGRESFRERHGLTDKYVVMYSGNHSPCHPLDTLLAAAKDLRDRDDIDFCFVGGGSEQDKVRAFAEAHKLGNVLCLPYQPLQALAASLSAADLHVVVMGDAFAGILHPCKIYNILAIGSPFLYIGPHESHIADLISPTSVNSPGRTAQHNDVVTVVKVISEGADNARESRNQQLTGLAAGFAKEVLLPRMIEIVESVGLDGAGPVVAPSASLARAGE